MKNKSVKKFSGEDLDKVLSSINAGRGKAWMVYTLRELVMYIRWLHGKDSTNDMG